jgi:hypothetical protein
MAVDTSSSAAARTAVVWTAAVALALPSAAPRLFNSAAAVLSASGTATTNDISAS